MNQIETLCGALVEISELFLPWREHENVKFFVRRYLEGNRSASEQLHGYMGQLLGIARRWEESISRFDMLTERQATLQKALQVRQLIKDGMLETLQLAVTWFQAERRRCR